MKMLIITIIGAWLICGYFAHGLSLGQFTKEFPDHYHEGFCIPWSYTFGPLALGVAYFDGDEDHPYLQHGKTKEERWEAFHNLYPSLSRAYFERTD